MAMIYFASQGARDACRGEPDLVKRLEKAFKHVQTEYTITDYQLRFRAALGAVMLESPDKIDKVRLMVSVAALQELATGRIPPAVGPLLVELHRAQYIGVLNLIAIWLDVKGRA